MWECTLFSPESYSMCSEASCTWKEVVTFFHVKNHTYKAFAVVCVIFNMGKSYHVASCLSTSKDAAEVSVHINCLRQLK